MPNTPILDADEVQSLTIALYRVVVSTAYMQYNVRPHKTRAKSHKYSTIILTKTTNSQQVNPVLRIETKVALSQNILEFLILLQ